MATKYTAKELEHHLSYEISMLNGSYELILNIENLLAKGDASEQQIKVALNAMKEDFCLHARGLLEFFIKKKTNSASKFTTSAYVLGKAPPGIVKKLNNQIAHFMEGRTAVDADKIWGTDRDTLLRWIDTEMKKLKWDVSYSAMSIPTVNTSLIPSVSSSNGASGAMGPSNYITSTTMSTVQP
jgi:hypothetical protein